ncbi:MAG: non-ribosomal peptide synthetase, partial [Ruminococcus sp.]|nr:non-ribosomal peptide synthetase [Ruminococcus sp.]
MIEFEKLKQEISEMLPVSKELSSDQNLISAGINSLMVMRFVSRLRKEGIKISYGDLLEEPTLTAWYKLIVQAAEKKDKKKKVRSAKKSESSSSSQKSFPLTDIQYAYKIGREDGRELGGVGCHAFMEFSGKGIDAEKLDAAWKKVQYHHPMLRARFLDNGEQEIMDKPFSEHIDIIDLSNENDWEKKCTAIGEKLTHRKFEVEKGHVCAFTLVKAPDNEYRLFYDVDLLVADVQSFNIILRDLAAAYKGRELPEDSLNWDFAAYLENKKSQEAEDEAAAKEYWSRRINDIALAPELPLAKEPSEIKTTRTERHIVNISMDTWNKALAMAAKYNITPAIYLMTVYAMIIGKWSSSKRFLINIPTFDRRTEYGASENAVADFTTLMLLEADLTNDPSFEELALQIKKRLGEDMKYTSYSGVRVQRDIISKYGEVKNAAPVVFACNFGNDIIGGETEEVFGKFERMLSQTPGVWIDFQSYETQDRIMLSWDTVVGLFPDGVINDMMSSMEQLIINTSENEWNQHFDLLPPEQRRFVEEQKNIVIPEVQSRLFDGFMSSAEKFPDKTAIIDTGAGISLSYKELKEKALS